MNTADSKWGIWMTTDSWPALRGKFKCRICKEEFDTAEELRFHQQLGHLK